MLRQVNGLACLHGLIAIQLADDFHGGVHAQDGNTRVYGDDVPVCHVGSHGTAAALIDLAQSGDRTDRKNWQSSGSALHSGRHTDSP